MEIYVSTRDLQKALKAVLPHASSSEFFPMVRFAVSEQNVFLQTTNTVTSAMALVSVWGFQNSHGLLADSFDLHISAAKDLLRLYKPKDRLKDQKDDQLRITVGEEVEILDVSGLFPGKQYTVPKAAWDRAFPNLPSIINRALAEPSGADDRLLVSGSLLKLFAAATEAYGHTLTLEPSPGSRLVVLSCGESFLGGLYQAELNEHTDQAHELDEWREGWRSRLPDVAASLRDDQLDISGPDDLRAALAGATIQVDFRAGAR